MSGGTNKPSPALASTYWRGYACITFFISPDASLELLLTPRAKLQGVAISTLLSNPTEQAAVEGIVTDLDGLPLALALAAAYLETFDQIPLEHYWTQLRNQALAHPSLEAELAADLPTGHAPSIQATFALSYDQLDDSYAKLMIAICG